MESCFKYMNGVEFGAHNLLSLINVTQTDDLTYHKLSYELNAQDRVVMVESCKRFELSKPRNYWYLIVFVLIINYHMVLGKLSYSIIYRLMDIFDDFAGYSNTCIELPWNGLIINNVISNGRK